jgi:cell division septation protein DedD
VWFALVALPLLVVIAGAYAIWGLAPLMWANGLISGLRDKSPAGVHLGAREVPGGEAVRSATDPDPSAEPLSVATALSSVGAGTAAEPAVAAPPGEVEDSRDSGGNISGTTLVAENTGTRLGSETVVSEAISQYYLHVSSFRSRDRADIQARRLAKGDLRAIVRLQTVHDAEWFRVYVGPFATNALAEGYGQKMAEDGEISYCRVVELVPGEGN